MNSTPTTTANTTAKAIARLRFPDDRNRHTISGPTPERFTFDKGRVEYSNGHSSQLLPGVVRVPVGPHVFDLYRVDGPIMHPRDGSPCAGLTYPERAACFVDVGTSPVFRLSVAWHELSHAMLSVYDFGCSESYNEETVCDTVGMFMAGITPHKYREIVRFITCEDLLLNA